MTHFPRCQQDRHHNLRRICRLREQTPAEAYRSAGHVDHEVRHGRRSQISRLVGAPIMFSRVDKWVDIPYPRCFPLMLDPTIRNIWFKKVLIDGGSALNILFTGALTEFGLQRTISSLLILHFGVLYLAEHPNLWGRSPCQFSLAPPTTFVLST